MASTSEKKLQAALPIKVNIQAAAVLGLQWNAAYMQGFKRLVAHLRQILFDDSCTRAHDDEDVLGRLTWSRTAVQ